MPHERHRTHTKEQADERHDLPPHAAPPHHGVHHKVAREHLDARGVDEHARGHGGHEALDARQPRVVARAVTCERGEAERDACGHRERERAREHGLEDVPRKARESAVARGGRQHGDADTEREALEELVEEDRGHEGRCMRVSASSSTVIWEGRTEFGPARNRQREANNQRVQHDADL